MQDNALGVLTRGDRAGDLADRPAAERLLLALSLPFSAGFPFSLRQFSLSLSLSLSLSRLRLTLPDGRPLVFALSSGVRVITAGPV